MTIREYIDEQDAAVIPRLEEAYQTIANAIPDAEERISWGMPTFWKGRNIIHFAAAKKHLGLYPGAGAVEAFADRLVGYRTSKGTVQLPYDKPFPSELVADIARWSYQRNAKI